MAKRRNKKINWKIFVGIIAIITISVLAYQISRPLEIKKIPASFIYSNMSGFEAAKDELTFGALTANQGASRSATIKNEYEFPVKIKIKSLGEISEYIITSENNFILDQNESKEIVFSAYALESLGEYGRYSGTIIIEIRKA